MAVTAGRLASGGEAARGAPAYAAGTAHVVCRRSSSGTARTRSLPLQGRSGDCVAAVVGRVDGRRIFEGMILRVDLVLRRGRGRGVVLHVRTAIRTI